MISPHNEWYIGNVLVCAHFSPKLAHGTYCLCSITQVFRLLGIVQIFFPMLIPKPCSDDFNKYMGFGYREPTQKIDVNTFFIFLFFLIFRAHTYLYTTNIRIQFLNNLSLGIFSQIANLLSNILLHICLDSATVSIKQPYIYVYVRFPKKD